MEYYSVKKRNKAFYNHRSTLETLSERRPLQKATCCVILFIRNVHEQEDSRERERGSREAYCPEEPSQIHKFCQNLIIKMHLSDFKKRSNYLCPKLSLIGYHLSIEVALVYNTVYHLVTL